MGHRNEMTALERFAHDIKQGNAPRESDARLVLTEFERMKKQLEDYEAVIKDKAEEMGMKKLVDALMAEQKRLQDVVVSLREHLNWSLEEEYRYTATFE